MDRGVRVTTSLDDVVAGPESSKSGLLLLTRRRASLV
jgi:hypothetical protein